MMNSVATLLSDYIQINTSTSNGNEKKGLLYLQSLAKSFGLFTFYHETTSTKGNLIISIRDKDLLPFNDEVYDINSMQQRTRFSKPPTVLLSHVDVVDAEEEDWTHHPFLGAIVDGEIWGRGAIDAKQIGISHLLTMKNLKDMKLNQPLIQIITSEEESGSENGLKRLLSDYPFLWNDASVWNEGGGFLIEIEGKLFYLVETGQKGNMSFTVQLSPKKSTNPYLPSSEVDLLTFLIIDSFKNLQLPNEVLPLSVVQMLTLIAKELRIDFSSHNYESIIKNIPTKYNRMFSAMVKSTFTLTKISGGRKNTESKGQYKISFDARPLPGTQTSKLINLVQETVKNIDPTAVIDWISTNGGYDQGISEEMRVRLEECLKLSGVNACVVPFMTIGSNDGRYFQPLNATVLGYCPMTPEITFDQIIKRVHGVNERISVKDLEFGIDQLTKVLEKTLKVY